MTIFFHELRQNRVAMIIWTAVLAFMLGLCVWLFPMLEDSMAELQKMIDQMGEFAALFGEQAGFTDFYGYFSMECVEILGIGGALFAGITAVSALAKEEKDHTAEFLLTHPVSRSQIVSEKLLAVTAEILLMDIVIAAVSAVSVIAMRINVDGMRLTLLFVAYTLLHLEIGFVCFGLSSCLKRGFVGIGLGTALLAYAINLISQINEKTDFLKNLTPFGFTDGAYLIEHSFLPPIPLVVGAAVSVGGILLAYLVYRKKDIA